MSLSSAIWLKTIPRKNGLAHLWLEKYGLAELANGL